MKTQVLKAETVQANWWVVDATDQVVGRLAAKLAPILQGKHRPDYTPHVLCGDFVIVINADKVKFTGRKWENKIYDKYSGYLSGRKETKAKDLFAKKPEFILWHAIKRMLPKNKLAYRMIDRVKIYAGPDHPHQAQQPKPLSAEALDKSNFA